MRPRIGLTLDLADDGLEYRLKRAYAEAVLQAGGIPLALPYTEDPQAIAEALSAIDGLVVTGGAFDIGPELYGAEREKACGSTKEGRTRYEWAACEQALGARKPVLGVCGGMQLLNVVRGGTLWQDLVAELKVASHEQPPPKDVPTHLVVPEPGTLLSRLVGSEPLPANTTHHQAVRAPGRGVVVSGRAPDGVIEAIEIEGHPFALGVQWHPEAVIPHERRHAAIYRGLVAACAAR